MSRRVSRRTALKAMGAMATLLALPNARSVAFAGSNPFSSMAFDPNERRTVAIVGSGVAGLTAAYLAAKAGFRVVVFEGDDRYGGRSLTVRPSDTAYREWWFD
ncbi:MAG: FAD-dependent oxidoreductase, partial [Actinomycetota bacterium]